MNIEHLDITSEEVLSAIREGVAEAFWNMIIHGTSSPCQDFYDSIQKGVEHSINGLNLEIKEKD